LTEDAKENLRCAWQQYWLLKKQANSDHVTWIEDLAAARAAVGHSSVASEIRQLLLREQQRRDA
jgi:macrodomain Ter protein organizer (MatP/YcbG family)